MSLLQTTWAKFMKIVFVFNNFLFLILGLTAIGFGIWGVIQGENVYKQNWFPTISDETLQKGLENNIKHAFTWLIVGAVILVGIAFLGFCGGCKENRCLLGMFFSILFVLTLIFFAALILFFAFPGIVTSGFNKLLEKEKRLYLEAGNSTTSPIKNRVDIMQRDYECCLFNETIAEKHEIKSCFSNWDDSVVDKPAGAEFHDKPCSQEVLAKLRKYLHDKKTAFSVFVAIIIIICIIQMILSLYICCKLKSQTYETMS